MGALALWGDQSNHQSSSYATRDADDGDGRTGRVERVHLAIMSCEKYYHLDTATNTCARQARCAHFSTWRLTWTNRVDTRDLFGVERFLGRFDGGRMDDGRWMETDDGFCVCF